MANISMCKGIFDGNESDEMIRCPKRDDCYRYTAPVNPYQQPFFIGAHGKFIDVVNDISTDRFHCEYFLDNVKEN